MVLSPKLFSGIKTEKLIKTGLNLSNSSFSGPSDTPPMRLSDDRHLFCNVFGERLQKQNLNSMRMDHVFAR
jgi:hypothetical protein